MLKSITTPQGRVQRLSLHCPHLIPGPLATSPDRIVDVYIPHGHNGQGLPLLVDLVGFLGSGPVHTGWVGLGENVPERLDRLHAERMMPPTVVAFPDCFTRLGGNQYINSAVTGAWMDTLCADIVPMIETHLGCGGPGRRGVFGKSSGGYGAIMHAMLRSDFWSAAACHSGDMGFEWCYLPDMPATLRALARHNLSIKVFVQTLEAARKIPASDSHALMILAMAATYDPDPEAFYGIRLPVTLDSCELIPERWDNWMAWDPIRLAPRYLSALASLKCLWIDCGNIDQYNLVYGARRLHTILSKAGIAHRYEEFADDHSSINYRMDESLPFLARALS